MFLFFLHFVLGLQLDFSSKHDNNYQAEKNFVPKKQIGPKPNKIFFLASRIFTQLANHLAYFVSFFKS